MKSQTAESSPILQIPPARQSPWQHAWLLAVAATALGSAIQLRDGLYTPNGFIGLSITLVAVSLIYLLPRFSAIESLRQRPAIWIFGAGIAFNFLQFFTYDHPGSWHAYDDGLLRATPFYYAALAGAAVIALGILFLPRSGGALLIALVVVFCGIGAWVIRSVPQPHMDVWVMQMEGLRAFRAGHNPFAAIFPDIYHFGELYAPGALRDGLVHQGFPYPPTVIWLDLPGYLIGGDYRWSNLAAMGLTALLIAFARPHSRLGPLAAALFLFTPRAFFMLESGWTEPVTMLLLAATVFCACRNWWGMPIFLGLFLCSKQYLIWAVPPVILLAGFPLRSRRLIRIAGIAFLTGCIASLPLILWDVPAFLTANFAIADKAGFRADALSYLALFANEMHRGLSGQAATLIGFTAAGLATMLATLRGERTPAGYAVAVAFGHLFFFAFYKFAFCNYYYFLIAAICCAIGALESWPADKRTDN